MENKIRSFLAIELDDSLKKNVLTLQKEFKKIDGDIKYVDPENMHITLKFFGDIDLKQVNELSIFIEKVFSNYKSFNLNLKGSGAFSNEKHMNVLWVGMENSEILKKLHDELDLEFSKIGFKKNKSFKSHLTIGRVKSPKNKDLIYNTLKNNRDFQIGQMNVNKIVLKKSTLTSNGPIYEDLKVFQVIQ